MPLNTISTLSAPLTEAKVFFDIALICKCLYVCGIEVKETEELPPLAVAVAIDSNELDNFCTLDARLPKIGIYLFYPSLLYVTVDVGDI